MKCLWNRFFRAVVIVGFLIFAEHEVRATPFTQGDLAIYQADASANNSTFSIVEINTTTANQTAVQTISINGTTTPNELRTSGTASSNGLLALSADRSLLAFTGHNSTTTSANANTLNPRGVGTLDANGNYNLATTYTGTSGNQTRGATTLDNSNWFISDQGGIYTNGSIGASPSGNTRGIKAFGGTVYALQQSATAAVIASVSATSGGTLTAVSGLPANNNATDFYMLSSANNGTYDELYVASGTGNGTGISKFSLVSGTWTANGTAAVTGGVYGIAAALDPLGGEDLYVTTGNGGANNSVLKFVDSAGFNSSITVGTPTTLFTAPSGAIDKGIEFVPIPVPEPAALVLALVGLAAMGPRLRRPA
ncbi:MAG TPA: PEP-CTERM sorting domain-containing protein [Pirellulales bacterium]|jgi:hypothetical protein|nr:PEP-CTERM sorting domain-containing protein [Pirellulales bacterium]